MADEPGSRAGLGSLRAPRARIIGRAPGPDAEVDIAIYDRALVSEEIAQLAQAPAPDPQ